MSRWSVAFIRISTGFAKAVVKPIASIAAVLLTAGELCAHDFWIEPSTFRPAPGATVAIGLRVGQNFVGDPVPRFSGLIDRFVVRQGGGEQPITGLENTDPAGWLRADGQGTAVIAYRSVGSFVELPAPQFEEYLRQEGLERIIAERARRSDGTKPGREHFYRYAKALLTAERTSPVVTQPIGLAYEIIPQDDPTLRAGPFRGRILYEGKPLPEALVVTMLRADPAVRLAVRSDAQGAFSLALPRAGVWLIKSVHMVRASIFSRGDWDSLWASLTFQSPDGPPLSDARGAR
jgi:uncharacterized GH25 family protein